MQGLGSVFQIVFPWLDHWVVSKVTRANGHGLKRGEELGLGPPFSVECTGLFRVALSPQLVQ